MLIMGNYVSQAYTTYPGIWIGSHPTADMPEYNHAAYSKNVTHILNNGIYHVYIF